MAIGIVMLTMNPDFFTRIFGKKFDYDMRKDLCAGYWMSFSILYIWLHLSSWGKVIRATPFLFLMDYILELEKSLQSESRTCEPYLTTKETIINYQTGFKKFKTIIKEIAKWLACKFY